MTKAVALINASRSYAYSLAEPTPQGGDPFVLASGATLKKPGADNRLRPAQ
jgi:hypothetical protein